VALVASGCGRKDDVLIAGAGPAGSMAALVLARAGVRVRLLDRATFPRDKLCGDTLNPGALAIIERSIGWPSAGGRSQGRPLHGFPLKGMVVTGPRGAQVAAPYPDGLHGLAITRRELDAWLLDAAIAAGAEFEPGVAVRAPLLRDAQVIGVRTSRGDRHARVVIGAEGRHARLAFALGLSRFAASPKRWAFGAYFTDVAGLGDRGEMHIRPDGYVGVAPLPGGIANVCVVRDLGIFRLKAEATSWRPAMRSEGGTPLPVASGFSRKAADIIDAAIAADPVLRARFAGARRVSVPITLGPLGIESRGAGCPGLLLAGDAAGFIDPMTGDGLRFALRGGELAAAAAIAELTSGAPAFTHLAAARDAEFAGKWRLNRALRLLVGSPRAVSVAAAFATYWPAPVRHLVGLAGDVPLARHARAHLRVAPTSPS
jgi:flavin-dependent dehydrogenase